MPMGIAPMGNAHGHCPWAFSRTLSQISRLSINESIRGKVYIAHGQCPMGIAPMGNARGHCPLAFFRVLSRITRLSIDETVDGINFKTNFGRALGRQGADVADRFRKGHNKFWLHSGKVWAPGTAQRRPKRAKLMLSFSQTSSFYIPSTEGSGGRCTAAPTTACPPR